MVQLDQGFKVSYFLIWFIMLLHTYCIWFFTESKIRLSSKFQTKFWKNMTNGILFDGVWYLQEVGSNMSCPDDYWEYPVYTWPGTIPGVYLSKHIFSNKCTFSSNSTLEKSIPNYSMQSIFSPSVGNTEVFSTFTVDTPFWDNCNDNTEGVCECKEELVTYQDFVNKGYKLDNNSSGNSSDNSDNSDNSDANISKDNRVISIVNPVQEVSISSMNNTKWCKKKATNFTVFDNECNDGITCFNYLCIKNETKCPDISSEYNFIKYITVNGTSSHSKKWFSGPISDININYNGIECSLLNKDILFDFVSKENNETWIPIESNHILSNYFYYENNKILCNPSPKTVVNYEDIIQLPARKIKDVYDILNITSDVFQSIDVNITNPSNSYLSYINNDNSSNLYISFSTHFKLDLTATQCSQTILQEIKFSFDTASKISLINIGNISIIEFCFLLGLCYWCYKHFMLLSIKTSPQNKLYYVKHFSVLTLCFFMFNLIIYNANQEYKDEIGDAIEYWRGAVDNKCFVNQEYLRHLKDVKKRLEEFYMWSYQIYENLLLENILSLVMVLLMATSKMTLRELWYVEKSLNEVGLFN